MFWEMFGLAFATICALFGGGLFAWSAVTFLATGDKPNAKISFLWSIGFVLLASGCIARMMVSA